MIGPSRKAFIGNILSLPPAERFEGTAAAVWYYITLKTPLEYLFYEDLELERQNRWPRSPIREVVSNAVTIKIGNDTNWRQEFLERESELVSIQFSFSSNGHLASYPTYPQSLMSLKFRLQSGAPYPEECEVPYSIACDKTKVKNGALKIKFQSNS